MSDDKCVTDPNGHLIAVNFYRALVENSNDVHFSLDAQGCFTYISPAIERLAGYHVNEIIGQPFVNFVHPDDLPNLGASFERTLTGNLEPFEFRVFAKDDTVLYVRTSSRPLWKEGQLTGLTGVMVDITERKRVEEALQKAHAELERRVEERTADLAQANRMLNILSTCNQAVVRATEEPALLQEICYIIVNLGGYPLVWVGFAEQDAAQTVRPAAQVGFDEEYLNTINITWADAERGQGPTGTAIRSGQPCIARDIQTDPNFTPWREEAIRRNYASSIALPLWDNERVFGALNIYAAAPDAFHTDEVNLLMELTGNLAFGIMSLRERAARKQAEASLRESEVRYRTLFEDSPISLWEEDFSQVKKHFDELRAAGVTDFRAYFENHPEAVRYCAGLIKVLEVNKATLTLVGVNTKKELLAPLSPVLAEESLPVFQEELIVLAEGGQRFESEMLHRTTAGEVRFIIPHISVAPGYENSLGKVLISVHDVTERKQAEEALRRAHDEMEGRVNQRTAELRKANEQLTTLYKVGQAITAPLQLQVVLDVIARSTAELLGTDTGVILLVDEAGETLTIQGAFGLSEAVVKGTRDRVGESIAGRVVQTGQPMIVNDLPHDPRFYNPSASGESLLACASVPLVVGRKIIGTLDIHSKTNRYAFNEEHIHVLNMLASQAAIAIENARLYEQLQLAHDELEMRVQQRTDELVAANAQLQQDIIERRRAEEEKDALQAQLLQAQKMESVGRLAGGVAHDFNNMLAVILIQVQLALRESDPAQPIYARLQASLQAAQHSADLTRQLLAFARKQTIIPQVLDLNKTVEEMLAMLQRLIGEDIDLLWKPVANLWPVKMDPIQINQILANLVVNARDAIAGAGKVIIETENVTLNEKYCVVHPEFICGDYVALTVSDNGSGMDKAILDHLFEPFFTTKEMGKGTGLGLSTVYGIVKQNDGFINVYSEPGKGSTFKIYLPRFASKAMESIAA